MNRILQRINLGRDFSVISVADDVIRGGRFKHRGKVWQMSAFADEKVDPSAPEKALQAVNDRIGRADFCAITGKIPGTLFFRFTSTDLPVAAQRGAVEFELPRRLLRSPERRKVQFSADGETAADGTLGVNVAVIPKDALKAFAQKLERSGCTADEFVYPFLAVSPELPELYLPEIEPEFFFSGDMWTPCRADSPEAAEVLSKSIAVVKNHIRLPESPEFQEQAFLPVLMCAILIARGGVHQAPGAFNTLPERVRPVRFRKHLIVSALLALLLVGNLVWKFSRTYGSDISEYRTLTKELQRLKRETSEMKGAAKRGSKELKEMVRVLDGDSCEYDALREFGLISEILPPNVMVSSMRWNDTDIDMVLQCENDKLDLPSLIQPLKRWRIVQLQQRQAGDSAVATITLKLAPIEIPEKGKKEARK